MKRRCTAFLLAATCVGCQPKNPPGTAAATAVPDTFGSVDREPTFDADTHLAAGRFAEAQGNTAKAELHYKDAIAMKPDNRAALLRLAMLYTRDRKFDSAVATWKQYVTATHDSPAAYNNLAYCYETAGKLDEAAAAYRSGIARDPKDQACRVNLGLMLARQRKFRDAREQWSAVLPPAAVEYNLGSVYEQLGETALARNAYHAALLHDPQFSDARKRLSRLDANPPAAPQPPSTPTAVVPLGE